MESKQIVLTLGYIALFCVALYFIFGLLKLSGQGLSSMGFDNDTIEGMSNREIEKAEKNLDKIIESQKKTLNKIQEKVDLDEFSDKINDLIDTEKDLFRAVLIQNIIKSKSSNDLIRAIQIAGMSAPLGALQLLGNTEDMLNL
tara:strand:+ start:341 stop:769 length:429 start_codon:yes stop_codon:yes gene_type:complete